ncbi:hypothetical protein Micbo1qcDRAFT_23131 [Microdochium bolleyi]|uniref:Uncharacterized protein n=1 Tax=Microdochium bolleyi TaxID=196109 RepID=A0A136IR26_9PEZI|nr:hypothetical protein Micbo1qcDRAFT_23131 [Microdochium bolleyi]
MQPVQAPTWLAWVRSSGAGVCVSVCVWTLLRAQRIRLELPRNLKDRAAEVRSLRSRQRRVCGSTSSVGTRALPSVRCYRVVPWLGGRLAQRADRSPLVGRPWREAYLLGTRDGEGRDPDPAEARERRERERLGCVCCRSGS